MSEHTPGPWVPVELKIGTKGRSFWVAISAEGKLPETEGNAYLIAAAPDLLATAKAVIAQWDTPNWKLNQPTADLINALRQAVERATP